MQSRSTAKAILLLAFPLLSVLADASPVIDGPAWRAAPPMAQARLGHSMVALPAGPSGLGLSEAPGKVMVIGGFDSEPLDVPAVPGTPLSSCEIYDPKSNVWVPAAPNPIAGGWRWAVVLQNGMLLVVGGAQSLTQFISSSHLYDPRTNRWIETGPLPRALVNPHGFMRAVVLPNGKVLIAGGIDQTSYSDPTVSVPIPTRVSYLFTLDEHKPAASYWSPTRRLSDGAVTQMPEGKTTSAIVMLGSGVVLNAGGYGPLFQGNEAATNTAILFDYRTGVWTSAAPMPPVYGLFEDELVTSYPGGLGPRWAPYSQALPDGRALIAGGAGDINSDAIRRSAVIYDPSRRSWVVTTPMHFYRPFGSLSARLPISGNVVVVGPGYSFDGVTGSLHDVAGEVFLQNRNQWSLLPTMNGPQPDGSFDSFETQLVETGSGDLQVTGGADLDTNSLASSASWIFVH